jgi:hypothetical protein
MCLEPNAKAHTANSEMAQRYSGHRTMHILQPPIQSSPHCSHSHQRCSSQPPTAVRLAQVSTGGYPKRSPDRAGKAVAIGDRPMVISKASSLAASTGRLVFYRTRYMFDLDSPRFGSRSNLLSPPLARKFEHARPQIVRRRPLKSGGGFFMLRILQLAYNSRP